MTPSCFLQHWKREQCYQHDVYHDEGASSLQSANNLKNLQLERIHYYPLFPAIWWNVFSAEIFANIWLLILHCWLRCLRWLFSFLLHILQLTTFYSYLVVKFWRWKWFSSLNCILFWSVRLVCPTEIKDLNYRLQS